MKRRLILHVPHSSDHIPMRDGFTVSEETIQHEILKLTDWHTEDLFHSDDDVMIVAPFSRVFCDTERFADDEQEVMSKVGMGVCYEKSDDGRVMRVVREQLRSTILQEYYWKHHRLLSTTVSRELELHGEALIVDCHSFPSKPFIRDIDRSNNRPDFNIGTDSFHTPLELVELSEKFFRQRGYTLGVDAPYAGTIVPMEFYRTNKNVKSIMLEVNRKLYLKGPTNKRSTDYQRTKKVVQEYLNTVRTFINK